MSDERDSYPIIPGSGRSLAKRIGTNIELLDKLVGGAEVRLARTSAALSATGENPSVNSLGMRFVPVPITGGSTGGKRVLFSIWQTRVQEYAAYAAANPGVDMKWQDVEYEGYGQGDDHPVVCVSWEDAKAFCAWLTEEERAEGRIGEDDEYRLPSDHEWSCAVGIGDREDPSRTPEEKSGEIETYPWGDAWPPPEGAGNYAGEECDIGFGKIEGYRDPFPFTAPVGSFAPSKDGLYDLGGNVWEWCEDTYDGSVLGLRVLRGGSWLGDRGLGLRSSSRGIVRPVYRVGDYGFRCVLSSR